MPAGVVAQIMGHKPDAAEKHSDVCLLDLLAKWHAKIEGGTLEQAAIEAPARRRRSAQRVVVCPGPAGMTCCAGG